MPLFWEGRISKLGIFRDHTRMLHGGCSAVLNKAAAIRKFLLNSWRRVSGSGWITTCSTLARNSIWNQWLQRRRLSIGPQARLSSRVEDLRVSFQDSCTFGLIVPAGGRDLGTCQSVGGNAERDGSGRKTPRSGRFQTMAVESRGACAQRVPGAAVANIRAAAFQPILGKHVRNGARKVLPWKRDG